MRLGVIGGLLVVVAAGATTVRIWQQGTVDERRPVDAIVVLGAAQYDGRPSPVFEARLRHAVELWHTGIAKSFVVTGGKLPGDRTTEAAVARDYAVAHGVPAEAIFGEDEAHNTLDSLTAVASEMGGRGAPERGLRLRPDTHAAGPADRGRPRDRGLRLAHGRTSPVQGDPIRKAGATVHELGALGVYFVTGGAPGVEQPGG